MAEVFPFPTKDDFASLLRERSLQEVLDTYFLRGTPFVFRESEAAYDLLKEVLAQSLKITKDSVTMIGSGRVGFSLDPDRFGVPFSDKSDLDIVVVSESMFDGAWLDMLRLGRKYLTLDRGVKRWLEAHRGNHIYWGFVVPDKLPGVVKISTDWFATFRGLARFTEFARYEVKGRLYRTWEHAKIHQLDALGKIKRKLEPRES
jgi:hypothetical protein